MNREHQTTVHEIAVRVKKHYAHKTPFRIFHGSTNSTRILSFKRDEMVDVSSLNHVLSVDRARSVAIVEPNVPMDKLVRETLRHGLIPPVVPEFPGITVGGGIQGGAGESSSFKWGCFSNTVNWQEMVLGDGRIIQASPKEHADLFFGSAGSFGSLGIITATEIRLIPAKKYVQLTYLPVSGFKEAVHTLNDAVKDSYDFIDGIMFAADRGVIMVGKLADEKVGKLQHFNRAHDLWYYLHAERMGARKGEITESVELVDYLFRYDRGAFWVGRYAFEQFGVPFNRFTRFILDPLFHTRKLYQALQDSGASQEHIVQDLALPLDRAVAFMDFVDTEFGIYPLWLCPLKPEPKSPLLSSNLVTPTVINIGVWGPQILSYDDFIRANKRLETKLAAIGGKKWMYAHVYYTEQAFWSMYDKQSYTKLRTKYNASSLPDVYAKTHVGERYAVNAKRAVFRTIAGRAKLRILN